MHSEKKYWHLLIFFVICYGVAAFGAQFTPGEWYQGLQRAPWNPPNAAFPIAWTILYALIAIAGWLLFSQSVVKLKWLWVGQLLLNAAWSWIFFDQHWVGVALLDILLLAIVLAVLVQQCFAQGQRAAGYLLFPYLLWIMLATSLNAYIFVYN